MNNMKLIAQGAEALIKQSKQGILKDRIVKSYRLPQLDNKLRKQRTRTEVKLLTKTFKYSHTSSMTW
ncbi:MAG: hypothetical protein AABW80_03685 [Nanoarchaeota archaeon]